MNAVNPRRPTPTRHPTPRDSIREPARPKFLKPERAGEIEVGHFDAIVGAAILNFARLPNGEYLVKGKTVTGFANVEEDFADNAVWNMNLLPRDRHVMPWRIEDALRARGANFIQAGLWRAFAVRDGNLVTGQQNFSGTETARLVIETLGR